jgi:hydrogenase nickel incorporation protein HypA/HybF
MHEVSICQSILETIEYEMKDDELTNIREIHLKVGVLSCIEPEVLQQVFTFMKIDTAFQNANLFIELVEVNAVCENCGNSFKVEQYKFICPQCDEPVANITEGKELLINKIILEEPEHEKINQ